MAPDGWGMPMRFEKWQALGNDYVIVEADQLPWELTADRIRGLCRPHFGIGSDGVLLLFPNRTNASFIRIDGSTVRARIFERGVGETLSSGTGASGAAVAAVLGGAESPITVCLDGGELTVGVSDDLEVRLTGTADPVFAGELSPELSRALERA